MAAWTSPGKVIGMPPTPPRRTSWAPTSPSPLRKSFTTNSVPSSPESTSLLSDDDKDDDSDGYDNDDDSSENEALRERIKYLQKRLARKKLKKIRLNREIEKGNQTSLGQQQPTLQVPDSPVPEKQVVAAPVSPQRVVLGIDRGKKASQVSLKNPWKPPTASPTKPPIPFADRLAHAVRENKRKISLEDHRQRKKARTFSAVAIANTLANAPATTTEGGEGPGEGEWCKYTGFNLRTRVLEQGVLKEEFKGKTTYSVSDLYRLVVPPLYEPPEYDTLDFLVTGIVASKSLVRHVRGREDAGNYIVVKITDLKFDIDLFLFGEAFIETWKLQRGMVVVLLNPGIFKRKDGKGFSLRMNENKTPLSRHPSSAVNEVVEGGECVLEVGFSRDWAGCEARRSDGAICGDWVDTRHSRVCAYHVDHQIKRARTQRMEYASGMRPFSPKKDKEKRNPFAPRNSTNSNEKNSKAKPKIAGPDKRDGGGGQVYAPVHVRTTSITDLDTDPTLTSRKRVDAIKRELKGSERDRDLRKKFKAFAPARKHSAPAAPTEEPCEDGGGAGELGESKAFDAKRVRGLGFDPRRRVNDEGKAAGAQDRKIAPIVGGGGGVGGRISLEGVLGRGRRSGVGDEVVESDSDDELDIVMKDVDVGAPNPFMRGSVKV